MAPPTASSSSWWPSTPDRVITWAVTIAALLTMLVLSRMNLEESPSTVREMKGEVQRSEDTSCMEVLVGHPRGGPLSQGGLHGGRGSHMSSTLS